MFLSSWHSRGDFPTAKRLLCFLRSGLLQVLGKKYHFYKVVPWKSTESEGVLKLNGFGSPLGQKAVTDSTRGVPRHGPASEKRIVSTTTRVVLMRSGLPKSAAAIARGRHLRARGKPALGEIAESLYSVAT